MKYYQREVTERKSINRFGKVGYVPVQEFVKTNNIDKFNKGKIIHFVETDCARKLLRKKERQTDLIYKSYAV